MGLIFKVGPLKVTTNRVGEAVCYRCKTRLFNLGIFDKKNMYVYCSSACKNGKRPKAK